MDIQKEFNKWFDASQLKGIDLTPGEKAMIQLSFEIGAELMRKDILNKIMDVKESE